MSSRSVQTPGCRLRRHKATLDKDCLDTWQSAWFAARQNSGKSSKVIDITGDQAPLALRSTLRNTYLSPHQQAQQPYKSRALESLDGSALQ